MWSAIPTGASYVAGSATAGGTQSDNTVRWFFSGIAAGDTRSATFSVVFSGQVNPQNDVWAKVGGQTKSASTNGSQRGFFWLVDFDGGANGTPDFAEWIVNGYPNPDQRLGAWSRSISHAVQVAGTGRTERATITLTRLSMDCCSTRRCRKRKKRANPR